MPRCGPAGRSGRRHLFRSSTREPSLAGIVSAGIRSIRNAEFGFLSSTWGPDSLLGIDPDFPLRLAEALPVDEFRIVLAPHPNIVADHSAWQFREYLSAAARAGVYIPSDVDAWRAAVVAADLVVGDHGSVSFYSTALGNPLLLAAAPHHTVAPGSPVALLLREAPLLDRRGDLAQAIRHVLASHSPDRFAEIVAATTSEPDASAAILRTLMYRTMGLPEPDEPAQTSALPLPVDRLRGPSSHVVVIRADRSRTAQVTRYPAERLRGRYSAGLRSAHLAVGMTDPLRRWLELADVAIGLPGTQTAAWIEDTLSQLPGCAVVGAPTTAGAWLIGDRNGRRLIATGDSDACRLFVSVVYRTTVVDGWDWGALPGRWDIAFGGSSRSVRVVEAGGDYDD